MYPMRQQPPTSHIPARQLYLVRQLACVFGVMCACSLQAAYAQRAPVDAGLLQKNLQNQLPADLASEPKTPGVAPTPAPAAEAGETIVTVSRFELAGVKLVSADDVQSVLHSFLARPLTLQDLQQSCEAIEKLYRGRGYLAYAVVPPQTVRDGVVTLAVTEAKLGQVLVDMPESLSRFGGDRAISYITQNNPAGASLNLNTLTHSLSVLNEVPGLSASSAMEPGANEGETNLRLVLKDNSGYNFTVEGNNNGSRSTGIAQSILQASWLNPSGMGDQASVNGIYSQGSHYTQGTYRLALLPNGLRAAVSASELNYKNIPGFQTNGGYGQAQTLNASLSYPWLRTDESSATATMSVERKSYRNYLLATDALSSSYNITNINLGLNGSHSDSWMGGGYSSGQIGLVSGQLQLNSDNPSNYGVYTPSRFMKLQFSGSRLQTLVPGQSKVLLSINGQLATENLNSAEQFYLGGPSGVRAYPMAQGAGSQGVQATLEYQVSLPHDMLGILFLDTGLVQQYVHTYSGWQGSTHATNTYSLTGTGFGVKWNYRGVNLAATVAWALGDNPLYNQQGQALNADGTAPGALRGWLTASYSF